MTITVPECPAGAVAPAKQVDSQHAAWSDYHKRHSTVYTGNVSYVKLIAYAPYNEPWHIQYAICANSITAAACEKVTVFNLEFKSLQRF